ncbi:DJ-1/PfpI family protein [Streptomyces sp. NPDC058619]|uniref:DJ-1/PfpI family protein n=1 Tax=unclassified Streptomyces TaxID=2593676 RepID=UPI00365423BB
MRVAFLVATEGIEQVELTEPWQAVSRAGGHPSLISPEPGRVQAFDRLDKADTFPVDLTVGEAKAEDFDALVLPGGVANPDALRVDEEVHVCTAAPSALITSRNPGDLPAFCTALLAELKG